MNRREYNHRRWGLGLDRPRKVCMFCGRIVEAGTQGTTHVICPDDENRSEACREAQREMEAKAEADRREGS